MYKRIKYISHYGCHEDGKIRFNSPASDTKKDYYFEVLNKCGYGVDHISRAACSKKGSRSGSYVARKGENTYRYFASWWMSENRYVQYINRLFVHVQWYLWLLLNLQKGEQIMVYHSLAYDKTLLRLKKWKNLRIIGDIEELYQDVHKQSAAVSQNEFNFIAGCDKFIFPNTLLNERLNDNGRPFAMAHGIYRLSVYEETSFPDNDIHLLYSGTFDPVKGGAMAAASCAEYLPSNYHLHVTGFGSKSLETELLKEIDRVNKLTEAKITYHGFLTESELLDLMHKCHIGLCTQDPHNKLNLTSFPSKILNYMANGMKVLVGRNAAIEESKVNDIVYYYDNQTPQAIAEAIVCIDAKRDNRGKMRLKELDAEFTKELKELIELR